MNTFTDHLGRTCENLGAGARYCAECGGTHVIHDSELDWRKAKEKTFMVDGQPVTVLLLLASDNANVRVCPAREQRRAAA